MACDIRIAKKEGGNVGLAEINLGVMPGMGGTQRLPRLVGKARALELCATGKTIAFEEALEMGLVHYIYEKENFMQEVMDYARQFTVPNKSSLAVGKVKRAIQTGLELSLPDGLGLRAGAPRSDVRQRRRSGRRQSLSRKAHRAIQGKITVKSS